MQTLTGRLAIVRLDANGKIDKLVDPREIAALAVFLASDAAKAISGRPRFSVRNPRHSGRRVLRSKIVQPRSAVIQAVPALERERYEFLDVLRGLSLLVIVVANMISYSLYLYLPEGARAAMGTARTDRTLDFLELVLVEGKLHPFSKPPLQWSRSFAP